MYLVKVKVILVKIVSFGPIMFTCGNQLSSGPNVIYMYICMFKFETIGVVLLVLYLLP
jgi:hypothetical protein